MRCAVLCWCMACSKRAMCAVRVLHLHAQVLLLGVSVANVLVGALLFRLCAGDDETWLSALFRVYSVRG